MLATLVDAPFDDPQWLFEIKWDGVRAIATVFKDKKPVLSSRNGKDLLVQFPEFETLARSFARCPVIVDGEIVAIDEQGRSSFQLLQQRLNRRSPDPRLVKAVPVHYTIFDLLYADGKDLRKQPLSQRKVLLERKLRTNAHVMLSKHILTKGKALYSFAKRRSLEGVIGKRVDSPYLERRTRLWVKIKTHLEQECVIGGWTEPRGSREEFGALLLGLYDKDGLHYVGHVGTGFNRELLHQLMQKLKPLGTTTCPFLERPKSNAPSHWVKPKLVAEVKFAEWTNEGIMRAPVFVGLRYDKDPRECVRETPKPAGALKKGKAK